VQAHRDGAPNVALQGVALWRRLRRGVVHLRLLRDPAAIITAKGMGEEAHRGNRWRIFLVWVQISDTTFPASCRARAPTIMTSLGQPSTKRTWLTAAVTSRPQQPLRTSAPVPVAHRVAR